MVHIQVIAKVSLVVSPSIDPLLLDIQMLLIDQSLALSIFLLASLRIEPLWSIEMLVSKMLRLNPGLCSGVGSASLRQLGVLCANFCLLEQSIELS